MNYHDSVDWLRGEVVRLKELLGNEQAVHREFRVGVYGDAEIKEVFERRQRQAMQQRSEDYKQRLLGEIEMLEKM
jgi:hypothetical protein